MQRLINLCVNVSLIVLSATLLVLIFPRFEMNFLAWIALVPLFLLIMKSGPWAAFLSALAAGFISYSVFLSWLFETDGVNPFNFGVAMLAHASYIGLFGLIACYFRERAPRWNVVTFPAAWVILEYLRSHMGFLSSPWGILGYSQYTIIPVARVSLVAGVYGVSFLIVTANTVLSEIILYCLSRLRVVGFQEEPSRARMGISAGVLATALIVFSVSFLYGMSPVTEQRPSVLTVAVVQGNIQVKEKYDAGVIERVFQKYRNLTLSAAASGPDLIVWPESSVPGRIPYDTKLVSMLSNLAQETGAFLLLGTARYDKFNAAQKRLNRTSNAAFLFSPEGNILGRYDKILLLPFDQYLPLRGYFKWPSWIVSSDVTDYEPGREMTIFQMVNTTFGAQICWENSFPELFRQMSAKGVDFMVSMTNEGFTKIPAAHYQLLAMNVFRAIENHVSVVRAAVTGVSCIIDPDGRIVDRVKDRDLNDVNVEGYLTARLPLTSQRSFYNRYGDVFIYILFAVLTGVIIRNIIRRKKIIGGG